MKTLVQAMWLFHLGVGEFLAFLLSTMGFTNLVIYYIYIKNYFAFSSFLSFSAQSDYSL